MNKNTLGAAFIQRITTEVLSSTAVNHPYLKALQAGHFADIEFAFRDFAYQYGLYSTQFIRYLNAVIDNCSDDKHRQILQSNLAEEKGNIHDVELPPEVLASIAGQPHARLFRRFQQALGIDGTAPVEDLTSQPGQLWSQQFSKLCEQNQYVGIGAIGIGTELIVSKIYNQILVGLKAHSQLTATERVFFDLHSECDEDHAAQMLLIAEDLAQNAEACEQIEYGVTMAIAMRTEFWDTMLLRAQNLATTTSSFEEVVSA